jgi:DNA-binding transcriptional ArsR family regulator
LETDMQNQDIPSSAGWRIGESICMELDLALSAITGQFEDAVLPEDLFTFLQSLPPDWKTELRALIGDSRGFYSILESGAVLADVLTESDYSQATLAIRELSVGAALERLTGQAASLGIEPQVGLSPASQLIDLYVRLRAAAYQALGFNLSMTGLQVLEMRRDIEITVHILDGEDLHARFWHWLDRFYYEAYRPWRQARNDVVEGAMERASVVLGGRNKTGVAPDIAWLPAQSPILRYPEFTNAVNSGKVTVYFWGQPFGMSDSWSLLPGLLICSFDEPGALYKNFLTYADDLAKRAHALADPTRLMILRIIRYFGMDNTEIAAFLGLSRPTVSIHARILREAGLIRTHADGRSVRHELNTPEVRRLFEELEKFLALPEET